MATRAAHLTPRQVDFAASPFVKTVTAYIGVGANLGDPQSAVRNAIQAIAHLPCVSQMIASSLYASAPVDAHGSDYVNAVVQVETSLSPYQLLAELQELEHGAGRTRDYRNAPRTLDLDVLLYGAETINTPALTIPHPRMWERAFVLVPLAELSPQLVSELHLEQVSFQRIRRLT